MKAAPSIESIDVIDSNTLKILFEGMNPRYVYLSDFPLLGVAKRLIRDEVYLRSFKLVDGIPEWDGQCLLGPEDLLVYSKDKPKEAIKTAGRLIKALKAVIGS